MVQIDDIGPNVIRITVQVNPENQVVFIVDGNDPEEVLDRDGNVIGYTTLPDHKLLIQDFVDQTKLEYFVNLLVTSPNTAYDQYLIDRKNL